MCDCIHHDRFDFTVASLFTLPVLSKIVLPCCNAPQDAALFFRHEYFLVDNSFDVHVFEIRSKDFCNAQMCPHYKSGKAPIREIALGLWRKCPGRCITCYNHSQRYPERELAPAELSKCMADLIDAYSMAEKINTEMGAPAPSLLIGSAGDLFFSENYRNALHMNLAAMGFKCIKLITSLQTWTVENVRNIHQANLPLVREIIISLDSADPAHYEKIREGSRWANLVRGYQVAVSLFPEALYKLSSTVSKANLADAKELPDKIAMLFPKVSRIEYHSVANWTGDSDGECMLLSPEEKAAFADWCAKTDGESKISLKFLH